MHSTTHRHARLHRCLSLSCLLWLGVSLPAQRHVPSQAASLQTAARNPRDWAADVAGNEIADIVRHDTYLRYRVHVIDAKGDRTREVIEAREGTISRTVLRNSQPLSEAEDKAERDRLTDLLNSPSSLAKHLKGDVEGKKLAVELIRLMPDAMIWTYAPGQPELPQPSSGEARSRDTEAGDLHASPHGTSGQGASSSPIVLDYKPNPDWKPPTTTAEALSGLEGRMWIDPSSRQLLRMEGSIFHGVNLGWGMLAHIYPGGKLVLEQSDAGSQRWIYTHFTEQAVVRALMLKTIDVHTDIAAADFHSLPGPISYQEAIHMLLETPPPAH